LKGVLKQLSLIGKAVFSLKSCLDSVPHLVKYNMLAIVLPPIPFFEALLPPPL